MRSKILRYVNLLPLFITFYPSFDIIGQSSIQNYQNMVPPSPEAFAFSKNFDIPVNYSSGVPQIGIPIYNLSSGLLQVQVSLNYNASGIRVEETPTWVGLGWNLNIGGSLTRAVRGLPDDRENYGYIHSPSNRKVKYVASLNYGNEELIYINNTLVPENLVDLEPDIFAFSAMGYSGKFYYNQDSAKFIMIPYQNIQIECTPSMINISEFILTLPNGVKCYFGGDVSAKEVLDYSYSTSYVNGEVQQGAFAPISDYVTSWHIKTLIDPSGKTIEYSYVIKQGIDFGRGGESYDPINGGIRSSAFYYQGFDKPELQTISWEMGDIYFKRSTANRLDVAGDGGSLDSVIIMNKNGAIIKSYRFEYDYFNSQELIMLWGISHYADIAQKRLYLKSISEVNDIPLPPYRFWYSEIELPNRLSSSQDYWGYFNGKINGQFLMPRIPLKWSGELPQGYHTFLDANADRRIDTNLSKAGILKKISYPTGGTSEFFYEQNRVSQSFFNSLNTYAFEPPDMADRSFHFMPLTNPEPPYSLYFSAEFSIERPVTKVKITPTLPSPCNLYADQNCKYNIKILSLPNLTQVVSFNTTGIFYLHLPEGQYKIESFSTASQNELPNFHVRLDWGEFPDPYNFLVGGLRIKKILSLDSAGGKVVKTFEYLNDSIGTSSGILQGYPVHIMNIYDTLGNVLRNNFYSNSILPLTTDGQTVLYQKVTEFSDTAKSNMRTEYYFSSDFRNLKFNNQNGAPPLVKDWQNHHLLKKSVFEKTTTGYRILQEESNTYKTFNSLEHLYGLQGIYLREYDVATEWWLKDSSTITTYSYPNDMQVTLNSTSKNYYNDKFLLANVRTKNSKGQTIDNKTKYPFDYNEVASFNIGTITQKNIIAIPIKQEISINGKIRSGNVIKYNAVGLPIEIYSYENPTMADTISHNRDAILDANYFLKTNVYYTTGNVIKQVMNSGNAVNSYLWNPLGTQMTAKIENGDSSSIAYSSFELDGKGGWVYAGVPVMYVSAATGKYVYNQGPEAITRAIQASGNYIVSYWSINGQRSVNSTSAVVGRTSNGWTYYEHKVNVAANGTITVLGTGLIDELRLYPENSLMTTYTYDPLIGMTSLCDASNRITHYEYDSLNRLSLIRDQDGNILKRIDYKYQATPNE